jgi:hypothetical protein
MLASTTAATASSVDDHGDMIGPRIGGQDRSRIAVYHEPEWPPMRPRERKKPRQ